MGCKVESLLSIFCRVTKTIHLKLMMYLLTDSQCISSTDGRKFLEEALRMRDFDHPHILTLIGIALDKDCDMPLVVLPFMRHGDLLSFIRDDMNAST